jgi:hypothetical protein
VLTFNAVAADGSAISGQSAFKYDGKDYPFSGSPDYDTVSLRRVNASTVKSWLKKTGKVVGTTIRTISAHGKVPILSTKVTNAKGVKSEHIAVYYKQ